MLKVGLYIDASTQPAWVHRVISDILGCEFATVALIMRGTATRPRGRAEALFDLYSAVDRRAFGGAATALVPSVRPAGEPLFPDACAPREVDALLRDVAGMIVPCAASSPLVRLPESVVDAIARYELDVALSLVPNATLFSEQPIARHGIWSYRFGAEDGWRTPPAFWEVFGRMPVTSSALVVTLEGSGTQVGLYRSVATTDKYSATRNGNTLWTAAAFVPRLLRQVRDDALPTRSELASGDVVRSLVPSRRGPPRNREMARLLLKHGTRVTADRVRHKVLPERWVLAYSLGGDRTALTDYIMLDPPGTQIWADPFPVMHDGTYWLFFEQQDGPGAAAHIAVMRLRSDGSWSTPVTVLARDHHLSYPFVFKWENCYYMIPETAAADRVELLRASRFPYEWEHDRVLLHDIRAFDVTLTQCRGRWWMFLNSGEREVRNSDELHLYSAPSPRGPWRAHAANPIRVDARNTRSAGRIFQDDGRLLRPAQDCGERYGRAIVFNEIVCLDDEGLQEREVDRIEPSWDRSIACTHTFNRVGELTVIDCLRRVRRSSPMSSMNVTKGGRHASSP